MTEVRRYSLRVSIGAAFAGVTALTLLLLGVMTFLSVRSFIREGIQTRLRDVAAIAAMQVDPTDHERILRPEDVQTEAYQRLHARLKRIRALTTDIHYIYTYRMDATGGVYFVVDAETSIDDITPPGETYPEASAAMRAALADGTVTVERAFVTDRWGTWLSAYAPIRDASHGVVAGLGIDMAADKVIAYERRYLSIVLLGCLLISGLVLLMSRRISRQISQPLQRLEGDMIRIQNLDLSRPIHTASRITEVHRMAVASENMRVGLLSFRRYVPAELVAELIRLRKEAVLGAEKRELTVLFADIAGFTSFTEKLPPEQLVSELSPYFDQMTQLILETGGTVDKFIGDAVMAFWNAPSAIPDHAQKACESALACIAFTRTLSRTWEERGLPPLRIRIGLCTGDVLVGNVGYSERLNYTAMGDGVNLASRLEGLNRFFGTEILIAGSTAQAAGPRFVYRHLGRIAVKGRSAGIDVFELVGRTGEVPADRLEVVRLCNEGMAAYFARDWARAMDLLGAAARQCPADTAIQNVLTRILEFTESPPPATWTGVEYMLEK
jgi:class 3 adenylate cyclase